MSPSPLIFKIIIFLFLISLPLEVQATAQAGDILIYKGEKLGMAANPLESFFNKDNPRPKFVSPHTANWRGYVATWIIKDDTLYLKDIVAWMEGKDGKSQEVGMKEVFPRQKGPMKAEWFSGKLRIPKGEMLRYVHMGYGSLYEKNLFLEFKNGKLIKSEIIDTRENWPKTKVEAVNMVLGKLPKKEKERLMAESRENLMSGAFRPIRWIQDNFGLWSKGNVELLKAICPQGCKGDEAAKKIYIAVWETLSKQK